MRLAALEEAISLCCEILLIRPELGGFHSHNKSVLTKQLSEKLNLFKALITASGVLYGIATEAINKSIVAVKDVGEDRNTIIHGILSGIDDGQIAFRNRGRDVPATLCGLKSLTERGQRAAFELMTHFSGFYDALIAARTTIVPVEARFQAVLQAWRQLHSSTYRVREITLNIREAEANLATQQRVAEVSKKQLRNARAQIRRIQRANSKARPVCWDDEGSVAPIEQ